MHFRSFLIIPGPDHEISLNNLNSTSSLIYPIIIIAHQEMFNLLFSRILPQFPINDESPTTHFLLPNGEFLQRVL